MSLHCYQDERGSLPGTEFQNLNFRTVAISCHVFTVRKLIVTAVNLRNLSLNESTDPEAFIHSPAENVERHRKTLIITERPKHA